MLHITGWWVNCLLREDLMNQYDTTETERERGAEEADSQAQVTFFSSATSQSAWLLAEKRGVCGEGGSLRGDLLRPSVEQCARPTQAHSSLSPLWKMGHSQ